MTPETKLVELRKNMKNSGVSAYLQPVHDAYLSEYPPACFKRVEWLSGFSGSAGMVVVTENTAALFTDGRYTLQAKQEAGDAYLQFNSSELSPEQWLSESYTNLTIGYDSELFTPNMLARMQPLLVKVGHTLKPTTNLVDDIWADRPAHPATQVFIHEDKYAGEAAQDKCQKIAQIIKEQGGDALLVSAPDALCWLLNIRADDVECTPLVLARAIIHADAYVDLLVDPTRLPPLPHFIRAHKAEHFAAVIAKLHGKTLCLDEALTPISLIDAARQAGAIVKPIADPITRLKAIKNPQQLAAIRAAHITDGAAIAKLLHWLATHSHITTVSEMDIADKLLTFRKENPTFSQPSFPTIAGSGPNGAIVHYRANEKTNRSLLANDILLLDSGGQYPGGTTDITRTIAIGTPTHAQKTHFTLVLKGHIALASAIFPKGTRGSQLDSLARQFLWQHWLDYDHGTGHGVGQFLGVHEGPQRISKRGGDVVLEVGMILSNEPGYYKENAYGIRIENLVTLVEKEQGFLGFDTITCAPIDEQLIDFALLNEAEKSWLANYQRWVRDSLAAHLPENVRSWMGA